MPSGAKLCAYLHPGHQDDAQEIRNAHDTVDITLHTQIGPAFWAKMWNFDLLVVPAKLHTLAHLSPCTECSYHSSAAQQILVASRSRLGIAQLLHGQLLLQADLLLLLQGRIAEVSSPSQPSLHRVSAGLPGLMPPPGALQRLAAQILPAQAHNCPHSVRMRGILHRHAGYSQAVFLHALPEWHSRVMYGMGLLDRQSA